MEEAGETGEMGGVIRDAGDSANSEGGERVRGMRVGVSEKLRVGVAPGRAVERARRRITRTLKRAQQQLVTRSLQQDDLSFRFPTRRETVLFLWEFVLVIGLLGLLRMGVNRTLRWLHDRLDPNRGTLPYEKSVFECMQRPLEFLSVFTVGTSLAEAVSRPLAASDLLRYIRVVRELGVIIAATWFLLRWIDRIRTRFVSDSRVDKAQVDTISRFATVVTTSIAVLISFDTLGVNVQTVLAFGGFGGVAIGFAGREIISNFFSGFMIYVTRPFTVGEWIRSIENEELDGTVEQIGWYMTRVRKWDKRPLYIPNSRFSTLIVETPSRMTNRRIKHTIHVRIEDAQVVREIVKDLETFLLRNQDLDPRQHRMVYVDGFFEHSIGLWLSCYTKTVFLSEFRRVQQEILLETISIILKHGARLASDLLRDIREVAYPDMLGNGVSPLIEDVAPIESPLSSTSPEFVDQAKQSMARTTPTPATATQSIPIPSPAAKASSVADTPSVGYDSEKVSMRIVSADQVERITPGSVDSTKDLDNGMMRILKSTSPVERPGSSTEKTAGASESKDPTEGSSLRAPRSSASSLDKTPQPSDVGADSVIPPESGIVWISGPESRSQPGVANDLVSIGQDMSKEHPREGSMKDSDGTSARVINKGAAPVREDRKEVPGKEASDGTMRATTESPAPMTDEVKATPTKEEEASSVRTTKSGSAGPPSGAGEPTFPVDAGGATRGGKPVSPGFGEVVSGKDAPKSLSGKETARESGKEPSSKEQESGTMRIISVPNPPSSAGGQGATGSRRPGSSQKSPVKKVEEVNSSGGD
uniref:Mechanosensitive ion channel protein n=1 Tax=Compsopogon caeruleus TaxID=31354 RepID=A0A7S1TEU1_9RHOD